jgi:hypothetical protein
MSLSDKDLIERGKLKRSIRGIKRDFKEANRLILRDLAGARE